MSDDPKAGGTNDLGVPPRERPWHEFGDAELVGAMRRGIGAAFAEVYRRHAPLLARMARRRRVPTADREALIVEHLEDTLLPILRGRRRLPVPFEAYLAAGFRRRLISAWRAREREAEHRLSLRVLTHDSGRGDQDQDDRERVIAEGLSEYALRTARRADGRSVDAAGDLTHTVAESRGGYDRGEHRDYDSSAAPADDATRSAREALARVLAAAMTPDEQELMGQVAERYPQREIAAVHGVAPATMRVRIHRLRARLMQVAARHIGALPTDQGILLARFLAVPAGQRGRGLVPSVKREEPQNDQPSGATGI